MVDFSESNFLDKKIEGFFWTDVCPQKQDSLHKSFFDKEKGTVIEKLLSLFAFSSD